MWFISTLSASNAAIARIDAALGYPRKATPTEKIGGGFHYDLNEYTTVTWAIPYLLTGSTYCFPLKQEAYNALSPSEKLLVVNSLPSEISENEINRVTTTIKKAVIISGSLKVVDLKDIKTGKGSK
jgi:isopentenyldiphosphate isomerase